MILVQKLVLIWRENTSECVIDKRVSAGLGITYRTSEKSRILKRAPSPLPEKQGIISEKIRNFYNTQLIDEETIKMKIFVF